MFNLPQTEEKILKFWKDQDIFKKSLEKKSDKGDFVFYDGPPFATGTPHYGHIVASLMKDIVPRYWTMKGFKVERKWGWDTHGLPIENIVEEELKIKSKKDIVEKVGVDKFNEACRSKVMIYADEWRKVVERMGRWVDMDNDYKTMDKNYMESIWWVFKELWDNDLIYEGYKSMHICPRCETTLSQSEVTEGYKDIKDLSVIVKFELVDEPGTFLLAWTTTPWTLPGNVALAVGEDVDYVKMEILDSKNEKFKNNEKYIFSRRFFNFGLKVNLSIGIVSRPMPDDEGMYELIGKNNNKTKVKINEIKMSYLIDKKYKAPFEYYQSDRLFNALPNSEKSFKIYLANFVNTEDGTGIVHIAPAFGEDDLNLAKEKNLRILNTVFMNGRFTEQVKDFVGEEVKTKDDPMATDKKIIEYLKDKNLLFDEEEYPHSYPHCWRCESPLLNYATSSWFVNVEKIKPQALKTAKKINWVPKHIKEGRFGQWLEGARDWSISRQRFWGSVMPIWKCDKDKGVNKKGKEIGCGTEMVFGSINELEKISGKKVKDLHKHFIDKITFPCPAKKCDGTMHRIPDVLDCWFESGSMPYAQMHYPFENKEKFEKNFPAEFIAEGVDQTRAWFYYMHIIANGIKKTHAYDNVIVNGTVLAEDGKKMSKRLNNYPDPMELMEKHGADKMRYYLCSTQVMKADNFNFSEKDMLEQTRFFNTLMNVLSFYQMFGEHANNDMKTNEYHANNLDNVLDKWIVARLEETKQKITKKLDDYNLHAVREIPVFIDDLSTWYVRRSRERLKGENKDDKQACLSVLRHVLLELAKLMAPFIPFTAEHIFQELVGNDKSVHLEDWVEVNEKLIDQKVLEKMNAIRAVVEFGLARRAEAGVKIRQPLQKISISPSPSPSPSSPIAYSSSASLTSTVTRLIEDDDEAEQLIKDELNIKEIEHEKADKIGVEIAIELDKKLTPELIQEGLLRELVRTINGMRKKVGLTIGDRIKIEYFTKDKELKSVFEKFGDDLQKQTLTDEILEKDSGEKVKVNGIDIKLKIVS